MFTTRTITITLPLTPYQPEELLIISTVDPSNEDTILANFSRPGMQYSITFDDLVADTSYTFNIRIVLRANTTVDVVQPAMGTFMTLITPSKLVYALAFPLLISIDWGTTLHIVSYCFLYMYICSQYSSYHHPKSSTLPANWCPSGWRLWWWLYCWNHHWFSICSSDSCGHRCHHSVLLEQNKKLVIILTYNYCVEFCNNITELKVSSQEMEQQRTKIKLTWVICFLARVYL